MSDALRDLLAKLKRVRKSGSEWIACCPSHEDEKPSLSIAESAGKILLYCHAGCTFESIRRAIGSEVNGLFFDNRHKSSHSGPKTNANSHSNGPVCSKVFMGTPEDVEKMQCALAESREVQRYIESRGISLRVAGALRWGAATRKFRDDEDQMVEKVALAVPHYCAGKLLGIKFKSIDGSKLYSQISGSSTNGLYALPHLDPSAAEVLIVEGPEDAALAISYDFNAVAINAADAPVNDSDIAALRQHQRIFVVGDQDVAGMHAMDGLQQRLPTEQIIRVRLPGFKDIGDLYADDPEKFASRLNNILRMARASREYFEPEDLLTENDIRLSLDGIQHYVIDKLVPRNAITMIFGEEKSGKSALSFYCGKCIINGRAVFGKYAVMRSPVLYMDLENSDSDIENFANLFARVGPEPSATEPAQLVVRT